MSRSISYSRLLAPLLIIGAIAGCAMHDQDLRQSLRTTKQHLDEAKKDVALRGESTQLLYEADLYWRRAWAARDDAAAADHLLFMAQGKLAMARSLAALGEAQRKLQVARGTPSVSKGSRKTEMTQDRRSTTTASAASDTPAAKPKTKGSETENALAAAPAPRAQKTDDAPATENAAPAKPGFGTAAENPNPNDRRDTPAESTTGGTETIANGDAATDPAKADPVDDNSPAQRPEPPASATAPTESQTASLTKEDATAEQVETEATRPATQPDVSTPEKATSGAPGSATRQAVSTGFRVNIPAYCRSIAAMVRGNKDVEQKCRELETSAQERLASLKSDTPTYDSIYKYCSNVARALGSGYQIMELCVDQELGVRPDKPISPQGYVMGDPGSNAKKSVEESGSVPEN